MQSHETRTIIALDIGASRIGVARANMQVGFANPLATLQNGPDIMADIARLLENEQADTIVMGLPRGLDGQETAQTRAVLEFGQALEQAIGKPVVYQDEALTSKKAEQELTDRGKPFRKGDIDALAATYILEDYLREHGAKENV